MKEILIGQREQFTTLPAEVEVGHDSYFLIEVDGVLKLMSRICPHAGYLVDVEEGELVCPLHGWTFELHTGRCQNVPSAMLDTYEVILRDDTLYAQIV